LKTLKIKRSKSFCDFTKDASGRLVSLSSSSFEGRGSILDQRIVKAVLSKRYRFESFYGAGLKTFIGQKTNVLSILQRINDLNSFFKKYAFVSQGVGIRKVMASLHNESVLVTVQSEVGYSRRIGFEREG